jgi:hypothetical protein
MRVIVRKGMPAGSPPDRQTDLATLLEERERLDVGICWAAQPLAGPDVESAAVAGAGEDRAIDLPGR